jgi:hypothetical protein
MGREEKLVAENVCSAAGVEANISSSDNTAVRLISVPGCPIATKKSSTPRLLRALAEPMLAPVSMFD